MSSTTTLHSWFNKNKEYLASNCNELEFKDSGRGSACINLETKKYIISICAWDHAYCLDIEVLDLKTEQSNFLHVGSCASILEFKEYLKETYTYIP